MVSSVGAISAAVAPPLGLAYIASALRESGTEVAVVDALAENVDQIVDEDGYRYQGLTIAETVALIDPQTDMIGVTCLFSQDWPSVRRVVQAVRERFPDKCIIAGGEHFTALPDFSLRDCPELDLLVLGEGEETIVDLIAATNEGRPLHEVDGIGYLEDDQFVRTDPRKRIRDVDEVPLPAWDLFPMEAYLASRNAHGVYLGRSIAILATRGCPYKCTFCSNPQMYGNLWMARDPDLVLDEIESYMHKYGVTNVDFYDLTFVLKRSWILKFCEAIGERGLKFTWQLPSGTRSEVVDEEVCAALYRSGCRNISFAPESGSKETLLRIRKQIDLDKVNRACRGALREGMNVKCNLIIGFPEETRRDVIKTLFYGWKLAFLGVQDVVVFLFSPYPGSVLFKQLREDGLIAELDDDYFRTLVAKMDPFSTSEYCYNIKGFELGVWRLFGMASFFGLAFITRPWRIVRFIRNVWRNEHKTVLEQRIGALVHKPRAKKVAKQEAMLAAASAGPGEHQTL